MSDGAKNNEDERWRMIIGKADQAALNAFCGISVFSFMIPATLKAIGHVATQFSVEALEVIPNNFSESFYYGYPLYLIMIVLAFRFIFIWHYKKKVLKTSIIVSNMEKKGKNNE